MLPIAAIVLLVGGVPPEFVQIPPVQPPRVIQRPLRADFYPGIYMGKIASVTKNSITIKLCGAPKIICSETLPDGTIAESTYVQDNTREPVELAFSPALSKGERDSSPNYGTDHGVADLRVGDLVYLDYYRSLAGMDTCKAIGIQRRPGGKVPPAHHDLSGQNKFRGRWDDKCNAEQFMEEVGMPMVGKLGLWSLR